MRRLFGFKKKRKLTRRKTPPGESFNYAMQEYHETVAPASSNDDGRISEFSDYQYNHVGVAPLGGGGDVEAPYQSGVTPMRDNRTAMDSTYNGPAGTPGSSAAQPPTSQQHTKRSPVDNTWRRRSLLVEPEMPDTTYEEHYGDAYVGGTIKYVYPSGYQSMRPRGGPWKLSIVVCVLFTWLSVFIVGHCSDRAAEDQSYQANEVDDDAFVIDTRWCGSRPLYVMWVMSMLITGLAMAYCSVIGYIKLRDFSVANGRSQPPGMMGKSEYYVRLGDDHHSEGGSVTSQSSSLRQYQKSIYQSDGTPAFWGGHIYRPTQAAVAVTSR